MDRGEADVNFEEIAQQADKALGAINEALETLRTFIAENIPYKDSFWLTRLGRVSLLS